MSTPSLPVDCPIDVGPPPSGAPIIFEAVHLAFGDNQLLRGVSFRPPLGETKAIFGVAGSGKSTLLKLALGLFPPDSGRITVLGNEVTQLSEQDLFPVRSRLGM